MALFELYKLIHGAFSYNERVFFTVILAVSHTLPVALHEAFLLAIGKMKLFEDCRVQANRDVDTALVSKCWTHSFLNHFFFMPLFLYVAAYPIFVIYTDVLSFELPSTSIILYNLLICALLEDTLFFWFHYMLHHPLLYKRFHKKHHEFKVLTGYSIASEYTHPVESVFGNIVPVMVSAA